MNNYYVCNMFKILKNVFNFKNKCKKKKKKKKKKKSKKIVY